jgi:hypothetical protein
MFQYTFTKVITKFNAFVKYMSDNLILHSGMSLQGDILIIEFPEALSTEELNNLTELVTNYEDPLIFLTFSHTETYPMFSSRTTTELPSVIVGDKKVLQTFIFSNKDAENTILNSLKTVIEYTCPLVENFTGISGIANFEIYDIDRNVSISNLDIPLDEISTTWETMRANGVTGPNTIFRSVFITDLRSSVADYDCKWQFRGKTNSPLFNFKLNSLQYIFYTVE